MHARSHPRRSTSIGRLVRLLVTAAGLTAALTAATLARPLPVAACDCSEFPGFREIADAQHVVVAGTALARDGTELTIGVEHWLWGGGLGQAIIVVDDPLDDLCNLAPNAAVGQRWLWVGWIPEFGPPLVNACQPSWPLDGPDGAKMLAEAAEAFGVGIGTQPPPAPATTSPDGLPIDPVTLAAALGVVAGGGLIFGSVAAFARRRDDHRP